MAIDKKSIYYYSHILLTVLPFQGNLNCSNLVLINVQIGFQLMFQSQAYLFIDIELLRFFLKEYKLNEEITVGLRFSVT